jgi:hypothetical protein
VEKERGEGREDEEEMADDVRRIPDEDCEERRTFEEEGAADVGGANAERLRVTEGLEGRIEGSVEKLPTEAPPTPGGTSNEDDPTPPRGATGDFFGLRRG